MFSGKALRRCLPSFFLLTVLLLRMVAGLPGVATTHTHGALSHTHASGGFVHEHAAPAVETLLERGKLARTDTAQATTYPVHIAVRHRPPDEAVAHTHASDGSQVHGHGMAQVPREKDSQPSRDPEHRSRPDTEHSTYFCAASCTALTSAGPILQIPPISPPGVVLECTHVKQRAAWRAKSSRGPPCPVLFQRIAFT